MQGYLCSSASSCPGKGPPQLNICTSTRLITHNTPAQPLPSLSPPQSSLERSREKRGRWEKCSLLPVFILQFHHTVLYFLTVFPPQRWRDTNVWLCYPSQSKDLYTSQSVFPSQALSLVIFLKHFKLKETLLFTLPLPSFHVVLTLNFCYLSVYLFPSKVSIRRQRTIRPILGIIPPSSLIFISKWEICHALCKFWWEISVWSCLCHWFD